MNPIFLTIASVLVGIVIGWLLNELRHTPTYQSFMRQRRKEAKRRN